MDHNVELTTGRYFLELMKLLFQSFVAYYLKRDDSKLEKIYYDTMDIQEQYVEIYYDDEEKEEKFREQIEDLLDLISQKEANDILRMKYSRERYRGLKLRENIIHNMVVELWLIDQKLWLYILEGNGLRESLQYYDLDNPYLFRIDQVYYGLKKHRTPGLLVQLFESEKKKKRENKK
ncbi:MAG: hypothetical protein ACOYVK_00045 [Bacillota bacterium]